MKLSKFSTFFQKRSQKLSFLSSVSRETGEKKKKETSFPIKLYTFKVHPRLLILFLPSMKPQKFYRETGFFFFFRQFHVKLTIKMTVFVTFFGKMLKFWTVSWNCELANMLKLSVRPGKIETGGRGEAACRQFQFFSGRIWQFQHVMPISQFHETCPKFKHFSKKWSQNCHFYSSVFAWNCAK